MLLNANRVEKQRAGLLWLSTMQPFTGTTSSRGYFSTQFEWQDRVEVFPLAPQVFYTGGPSKYTSPPSLLPSIPPPQGLLTLLL